MFGENQFGSDAFNLFEKHKPFYDGQVISRMMNILFKWILQYEGGISGTELWVSGNIARQDPVSIQEKM